MNPLNAEELDLLESVENDEWQSIPNLAQELHRYQGYAQSQALAAISIELPVGDMRSLQDLAQQTGTSVSLLVAGVIHQYVVRQSSSQS
jgi:predicted DNA binding CopG/RHH family protein